MFFLTRFASIFAERSVLKTNTFCDFLTVEFVQTSNNLLDTLFAPRRFANGLLGRDVGTAQGDELCLCKGTVIWIPNTEPVLFPAISPEYSDSSLSQLIQPATFEENIIGVI